MSEIPGNFPYPTYLFYTDLKHGTLHSLHLSANCLISYSLIHNIPLHIHIKPFIPVAAVLHCTSCR